MARELYIRVFIEYDGDELDQQLVEGKVDDALTALYDEDGINHVNFEAIEDREL